MLKCYRCMDPKRSKLRHVVGMETEPVLDIFRVENPGGCDCQWWR
jgi:hypothetical protein